MDALTVNPSMTTELKPSEIPELSTLVPSFLADLDVSPSSKSTYRTALNNLFKFFKDSGTTFPTRADLLNYKEELCQNHTARTVNLQLSAVRSFFAWTAFSRIYPNVAYGIRGIRIDKSPRRSELSSDQIRGILENIDRNTLGGRQKYAMVLLASTAGLRAAEISSLDVSDLQIVMDTSILRVKGKGYRDKGQIIQIGRKTDEALRAALALRDPLSPEEPMFVSTSNFSRGKRISPKGVAKILKNILRENNFCGSFYTAHSLRHSACCLSLEVTDQNLEKTKRFMRHANIETTLIYSHSHELFSSESIAQQIEDLLL